jgi:hypothetical protein
VPASGAAAPGEAFHYAIACSRLFLVNAALGYNNLAAGIGVGELIPPNLADRMPDSW